MKKVALVVITSALLAACSSPAKRMAECEAQGVSKDACYVAEQNRQSSINAAAESAALTNAANATQHAQSAKAVPGVADPLHAIKLKGQDGINHFFIVSIGNGYTQAMIEDEPAKIVRKNANWYEITNKKYIIGVYLDENGFSSSSWNRHKGRDNGQLFPVESEE